MVPDVTVITPETIDAMLLFSFRNRIPIFTFSDKYVEMGAMAAITVEPRDLGAQIGEILRKAMSGRTGGGYYDWQVRGPLRSRCSEFSLPLHCPWRLSLRFCLCIIRPNGS